MSSSEAGITRIPKAMNCQFSTPKVDGLFEDLQTTTRLLRWEVGPAGRSIWMDDTYNKKKKRKKKRKVNDVSNSAFLPLLLVKTFMSKTSGSSSSPSQSQPSNPRAAALVRSSSSFISSMASRVFFLLLLTSPFLFQVVRCQSDDVEVAEVVEGGDLGIVGDGVQDFGDGSFAPAAGVDTVCVFPKNAARLVTAGEESQLLVGLMNNEGESPLNVLAIRASLHLPFDHHLYVQNLTVQEFYNTSVPFSAQAAFPYIFTVNKYLQSGSFDLVGTIVYEIDQHPYQSIFYNGTIEVVEAGGFLSIESVFLFTLGIALVGLLFSWIYGQMQNLSKKTKRAPKVEVGTGTTDASLDEWLQGTAYAQSLSSNKSKKKK